jgi:D-glycero-D-manno-heptose 1,7-bisphosphate phosphatase
MNLKNWTLFLDRDGVINKRKPGGYIENHAEFEFLEGVLEIMPVLNTCFGPIVVVTNQQGIAKGVMTLSELDGLHNYMLTKIEEAGGRIDKVYFCPEAAYLKPPCRKPNTGMGLQAQEDFPEIDFSRSILVGDSDSDIEFGNRLGMKTVWINHNEVNAKRTLEISNQATLTVSSLKEFVENIEIVVNS